MSRLESKHFLTFYFDISYFVENVSEKSESIIQHLQSQTGCLRLCNGMRSSACMMNIYYASLHSALRLFFPLPSPPLQP